MRSDPEMHTPAPSERRLTEPRPPGNGRSTGLMASLWLSHSWWVFNWHDLHGEPSGNRFQMENAHTLRLARSSTGNTAYGHTEVCQRHVRGATRQPCSQWLGDQKRSVSVGTGRTGYGLPFAAEQAVGRGVGKRGTVAVWPQEKTYNLQGKHCSLRCLVGLP